MDHRQEKIGAKIRAAQMEKIPYMLVVGPQEEEKGVVALRSRLGGDQGAVRMEDLMARLDAEIASKGLNSTEE